MLRRMLVVLAAVFLLPTMPNGAAAGGGATFDFEDYYVAGDRAVGETVFWISGKDRHLLNRPFYAYLIPGQQWIDPPTIPAGAVPLGEVTLGGLARVSFTVPDVAPGGYSVGICDRPCRHSLVGDLMGGWITVVGSEEEARLLPVIDRLKARLDRARWDAIEKARKNQKRFAELRTEFEYLQKGLDQAREELGARLVAQERRPQAGSGSGAFDRAGWAVAVLSFATLALVTSRRRRLSGPEAPTLPDQLPASVMTAGAGTDDLGWQVEAAELEDDRTPVGRADNGRRWLTAYPPRSSGRRRAGRPAGGTGRRRTPRAAGSFPRSIHLGPGRTAGGAGTGRPTGPR